MEKVIDLTREEGARVLEKELFLYPVAKKLVDNFSKVITSKNDNRNNGKDRKYKEEEYYSTNFFIDGKRGTGKTSVLLTVREKLREKLKEEKKENVELLEIINLSVNQSGILLHVLSHINFKLENDSDTSCCSTELHDLFSKVKMGYPYYLKCSLEKAFEKLCELEIEELLDRLEGDFLQNLRKLIIEYKRVYGKDIVIFIDDLDLVQDGKFLYRSFLEMAAFLCLEHVHIIAAGDLENTYSVLKKTVGDLTNDEEAKNLIVQSFIDKVFPLHNRLRLQPLSILDLKDLKVKTETEKDPFPLKDFLIKHPTFKIIFTSEKKNEKILYYLFEGLPLREVLQLLQNIKEKIELVKIDEKNDSKELNISELSISNVFSQFSFKEHYSYLEIPYSNSNIVKLRKEGNEFKIEFPSRQGSSREEAIKFLKDLYKENEELAKKLFSSVLKFLQSPNGEKFRKQFKVENVKDLRDERKLSFLQMVSVADKRFYAILILWLTEVFNYNMGNVFFAPYYLLLLSFLYGIPNVFLYLERGNSSRRKESEFKDIARDPFNELEYISNFVDLEDLLYTLNSLDITGVKKHYSFKEVEKFVFFHNLTTTVAKRVIPHFYKFWFLPAIILENEIKQRFYYDPFIPEIEEDIEEQLEHSGEDSNSSENYLDKLISKLKNFITEITNYPLTTYINPLDTDKFLFALFKSLSHRIFKREVKIHSQTKVALYYILSLVFFVSIYKKDARLRDFLVDITSLMMKPDKYTKLLCKSLFKKFASDFKMTEVKVDRKTPLSLEINNCNDLEISNIKEKLRQQGQVSIGGVDEIKIREIKIYLKLKPENGIMVNYLFYMLCELFSNIISPPLRVILELENKTQIIKEIKNELNTCKSYEDVVLKILFYLATCNLE